jgi:O-antigen/teichoic acid export membrane protein
MNPLKKLAGQTVVYGLSSILGRFLNYLLVPLHTAAFTTGQYGIITEMYSYVAFLVVFLTYGMETAFFRYYNKEGIDKNRAYNTTAISLTVSSSLFIIMSWMNGSDIADWLQYPNHTEYVTWFAVIVALDALSSIPLARLRAENKAFVFAKINLINVAVNILLNLFFIGLCKPMYENGGNFLTDLVYDPTIGVGYVFISNLLSSIVKFAMLAPHLFKGKPQFDFYLWRSMMRYSLPILFFGLAGIVNETLDRVMLKRMLFHRRGEEDTMALLGIYGAVYKISIIMTLFLQAFRYAAEPFFFSQEKNAEARKVYSKVMTYFVIVTSAIFLGVMLFIDVVKYFIPNSDYWEGLHVVPVLLLANMCLGIYFNQSIWYKLTEKTMYGAYIAGIGAAITIILNLILIPEYDYTGSAWATLAAYASMMVISYIWGQKHYPIRYNLRKIVLYISLALLLYFINTLFPWENILLLTMLRLLMLAIFAFVVYFLEWPLKEGSGRKR